MYGRLVSKKENLEKIALKGKYGFENILIMRMSSFFVGGVISRASHKNTATSWKGLKNLHFSY